MVTFKVGDRVIFSDELCASYSGGGMISKYAGRVGTITDMDEGGDKGLSTCWMVQFDGDQPGREWGLLPDEMKFAEGPW